ncbi:hypothetical protein Tco_1338717 [Tanacetum coccineum]
MLEKGNYIPWESRFRRFLDNKLEEGEQMWRLIEKGPYVRPMITDPDDTREQIIEPLSKMTEINKKQYIADVRVMNYLLLAIPNDIYNSVDASKEGESLESLYERLTTLVNIMDRNNVRPIPVSINTKFLNCLQPEWSKYVTMVCHNQIGDTVSYDQLYDSLVQFEPHVQASKAKRPARNHDPLALIAHSNASLSQSNANPSYSNSPQSYYVTHPSLVVDYEEDYQREMEELTYKLRMQDMVEMVTCHYARDCQKPRVRDAKYFREQMLLAMKDEAGSNLEEEENDFMLDDSFGDETLEELTVAVIMMARIQPANDNVVTKPNYDAVSEVNASHKVHEQENHVKYKAIIHTSNDDQIDSNIIFDDSYVENNGGTSEHDSNAHDEYYDIQILAYNVQREAKNQKQLKNELKTQKELLQKELETCKEWVKIFKSKIIQCSKYKETCEELEREIRADKDTIERILKEKDKIKKNQYLEDIVDLEEKLGSHDRIVYKICQSIQTIYMLGKTLNKVYDPFLKAGLGYQNPERLKIAIAAQPKLYHGEML